MPNFKRAYSRKTNHPLHNNTVKFSFQVHYMCWGNQEVELHEWGDFMKSKNTRILAIIISCCDKTLWDRNNMSFISSHLPLYMDLLSLIGLQT